MKMRSWFDGGIILGNKHETFSLKIQNKYNIFEIVPNITRITFEPSLGLKLFFDWEKSDERFGIVLYLLFISVYYDYFKAGR